MTQPIEQLTEFEATALAAFVRAYLDPAAHHRLRSEMPRVYAKVMGRTTGERRAPRITAAGPRGDDDPEEGIEWFARGDGEPTLTGICPPVGLAPIRAI